MAVGDDLVCVADALTDVVAGDRLTRGHEQILDVHGRAPGMRPCRGSHG